MSGRTATWRQPVHSTFVITVNNGCAVFLRTQDRTVQCALASSPRHDSCGRDTASQSAREEI
eukprot:4913977-Prymnesium_polylepis.1